MTFRLALLLCGLAAGALAAPPKMAKELEKAPPGSTVQVIVQYRHNPNPGDVQHLAGNGGSVGNQLPSVKGIAVQLPA